MSFLQRSLSYLIGISLILASLSLSCLLIVAYSYAAEAGYEVNPSELVLAIDVAEKSHTASLESPWRLQARLNKQNIIAGETFELHISFENLEERTIQPNMMIALPVGYLFELEQTPDFSSWSAVSGQMRWSPQVEVSEVAEAVFLLRAPEVDLLKHRQPAIDSLLQISLELGESSKRLEIPLVAQLKPLVTADISPETVAVGQPLNLHPLNFSNEPLAFAWDLGDGRKLLKKSAEVSYAAPGRYTILLTATNQQETYQDMHEIEVVAEPAASFVSATNEIGIDTSLVLTHTGGGAGPLTHWWGFGDGRFSSEANPTHSYRVPGHYQIEHRVTNGFGTASETVWIEVVNVPKLNVVLPNQVMAGKSWHATAALADERTAEISWQIVPIELSDDIESPPPIELIGATAQTTFAEPGNYAVIVKAVSQYGIDEERWLIQVSPNDQPELALLAPEPGTGFSPNYSTINLPYPAAGTFSPTDLLFFYINAARKAAGVQSVNYVPTLSMAAQIHTDDMATHDFTGHTGFDGSPPHERVARSGYDQGGYTGEATAWGYEEPRDVVTFWLNSPSHQPMLLNPLANQVGVAQTINYDASRVWYWTAEFGSSLGSIEAQVVETGIRLISPAEAIRFRIDQVEQTTSGRDEDIELAFSWAWPLPLKRGDRFELLLIDEDGEQIRLGAVGQSLDSTQPFTYGFAVSPIDLDGLTGHYDWVVNLTNRQGVVQTESLPRSLRVSGVYPTATPLPPETQTPTVGATATPEG